LKVCFITHSPGGGGADRAFPHFLWNLQEKGVEVFVTVPSKGTVADELKDMGFTFAIIPYRWWLDKNSGRWRGILRTFWNLLMVVPMAFRILKWKCDIIYTNTVTVFTGALTAKLVGLPHVWHFREFGYEDYGLSFDLGERLSLKLVEIWSSICIANSHAVKRKYSEFVTEGKIRVIYEGVYHSRTCKSISDELNLSSDFKCIIVGGLFREKGQHDAIRAVYQLVSQGYKIHLYIVGDGNPEYKNELQSLISEHNLSNNITFLGYIKNPLHLMEQCDVVLSCSSNEAFGLTTIEGMYVGKPVIGTKSGGTVELIKDEINGLFYEHGNFIELSQKILYLMLNPEISIKLGENGHKWVRSYFTMERYGDEVLSIFKQLMLPKR
jgi:glycosyltransferase involved in cell wall biosynthesis